MSKSGDNIEKTECVQVVVRCRPFSSKEKEGGHTNVVSMDNGIGQVKVSSVKSGDDVKSFTYDSVFPMGTHQEMIYNKSAAKITEFVLQGYNGTIFAYGQTGTGKTFTMEGEINNDELKGITPRAFEHIFAHVAKIQSEKPNFQFLVSCQFVEIYMEDVMDLLVDSVKGAERPKLQLKENTDGAVYVAGASKHTVRSAAELVRWLEKGKTNRVVGATKMNEGSSRSHCIFTITIETCEVRDDGQEHIRMGKLNLVDLAGSERQGKTEATGQRMKEGIRINLSLTCLGQVISALTSKTPAPFTYRNSKLTRLLQDSLGGNTKTVMIANIGPADYNHDETVETLRFASRAKLIKNTPKVNEDPRDAQLRQYQDEIAKLKQALMSTDGIEGASPEDLAKLLGMFGGGNGTVTEKIVEKIEIVGVKEDELEQVEIERRSKIEELQQRHIKETTELLTLQKELSSKAQLTKEQLQQRNALLEKQRATKNEILAQLQATENKLRMDNVLLEQARQDAELLEVRRMEVESEEKRAHDQKLKLDKQDEDFFTSLQKKTKAEEDLVGLHKKLEKLQFKYRELKSEMNELVGAISQEREDLLAQAREFSKHIQFQTQLLQNFVPREQAQMIEGRAVWDEQLNMYVLCKFNFKESLLEEKRPRSLYGRMVKPPPLQKDPTNRFSLPSGMRSLELIPPHLAMSPKPLTKQEILLRAQGEGGLRYGVANIMQSSLDMHERTTQDANELGLDLNA